MGIGYKKDEIFLLSKKEYSLYKKELPTIASFWWLRNKGINEERTAAAVDNNLFQYGCEKYGIYPVRPAIKYSNIKSRIISTSNINNRIIFNDFPFLIVDLDNEIAIAEMPIAYDMFDEINNDYEKSSIRKKLLSWFDTGVWNYKTKRDYDNKASIGYFNYHKDIYKVFVFSDDNKVPCVYFESDDVLIGVELLKASYIVFIDWYKQISSYELNAFIKFMNAPSKQRVFTVGDKEYKLRTYWDYTIATWNEENPENPIVIEMDSDGYMISPAMPNYGELFKEKI